MLASYVHLLEYRHIVFPEELYQWSVPVSLYRRVPVSRCLCHTGEDTHNSSSGEPTQVAGAAW